MPRLFNLEVFNETVTGDATTPPVYYSVREHQAVLGSADVLHAQIIVEAIGDAGTVVTVAYQISNTGNEAEWTSSAKSTTVTPVAFTAVPFTGWLLVDAGVDIGAFGRFKVTSNKNAPARVRIVVLGRSY